MTCTTLEYQINLIILLRGYLTHETFLVNYSNKKYLPQPGISLSFVRILIEN